MSKRKLKNHSSALSIIKYKSNKGAGEDKNSRVIMLMSNAFNVTIDYSIVIK